MPNPDTYQLDVVYDPTAQALNPGKPMALTYGWVKKQGNSWVGQGQRPNDGPESVSIGDTIRFSVFSLSQASGQVVDSMTVSFQKAHRAGSGSPFGNGSYTANDLQLGPGGSYGCNMQGPGITPSALTQTVANLGDFECTVKVTVGSMSFQVDPELEVKQGGGP